MAVHAHQRLSDGAGVGAEFRGEAQDGDVADDVEGAQTSEERFRHPAREGLSQASRHRYLFCFVHQKIAGDRGSFIVVLHNSGESTIYHSQHSSA